MLLHEAFRQGQGQANKNLGISFDVIIERPSFSFKSYSRSLNFEVCACLLYFALCLM